MLNENKAPCVNKEPSQSPAATLQCVISPNQCENGTIPEFIQVVIHPSFKEAAWRQWLTENACKSKGESSLVACWSD